MIEEIPLFTWSSILTMALILVAGASYMFNKGATYLSLREHIESRDAINKELEKLHERLQQALPVEQYKREVDLVLAQFHRELDQMHTRLKTLEDTRPTTGELKATMGKTDE